MILARHAARLVLRDLRRSIATIAGTALAAALVTSVLLFGTASGTTITRRALADLPVDAQVVLAGSNDAKTATTVLAADPAVHRTAPFDLVHFDSAAASKSGTATQTSTGVLVGIPADYSAMTGLFRVSEGALAPGSIAISRDLASNLGVVPGDDIAFTLPGGATASLKVSGIVSISGADLLLGPIDAAHRAAGANPPTNVAVMPIADLEAGILPRVTPRLPIPAQPAPPAAATKPFSRPTRRSAGRSTSSSTTHNCRAIRLLPKAGSIRSAAASTARPRARSRPSTTRRRRSSRWQRTWRGGRCSTSSWPCPVSRSPWRSPGWPRTRPPIQPAATPRCCGRGERRPARWPSFSSARSS
jgi:putative ABC transport system permease protein